MMKTNNVNIIIPFILVALMSALAPGTFAQSSKERICNTCGQRITGSYFETGSHYYHPECFTCNYCGKPIRGPYTTYRNQNYHNECFENHVALRCAVCNGIIQGQYLLDYWGNAYHTSHKDEVLQCDFCQRFIVGSLIDGMKRFADGRCLCAKCAPLSVTDIGRARKLMIEVAGDLEAFGIAVDPDKIQLRLV
ncbi:MAG: LIM domain-containing protein, partial [bacterium]